MAYVESQVAYDNTGATKNEAIPPGSFYAVGSYGGGSKEVYIELLPDGKYVNYIGEFDIDGNTIVSGQLETIYITNAPLNSTEFAVPLELYFAYADNGENDIAMPELLKPQSNADFYEYLFRFDDTILGSPFKDKINGWAGNDLIWGGPGNDKEWGGPGNDTFYYLEGDGKDKFKDFSKKKDDFVFDRGLVKNFKQLKKAAYQKKKKVIVDFGEGDKITIDDMKLKKFLKSDFSFLEVDL